MWKTNVKVVKPGTGMIDPGNTASLHHASLKQQMGIQGGSTVALIREKDECLLVDTGYENESDASPENRRRNANWLKLLLELHGHRVEDVSKVFITHFHMDHFGGVELFGEAAWFCHRLAHEDLSSPLRDRFTPLDDGDEIIPGATVTHTPGHTRGHASLIWSSENRSLKVAVCGDAILSLAWLQSGYIWKLNGDFFDADAARSSIEKLLHLADVLIPGHGQPFFASSVRLLRSSKQSRQGGASH